MLPYFHPDGEHLFSRGAAGRHLCDSRSCVRRRGSYAGPEAWESEAVRVARLGRYAQPSAHVDTAARAVAPNNALDQTENGQGGESVVGAKRANRSSSMSPGITGMVAYIEENPVSAGSWPWSSATSAS
jgi:hypothetical protein